MSYLKFIQTGFFIIVLSFGAVAQTPETAKAQGIALYQKGDYSGAMSLFEAVVKINKKDGEAFYFLGASQSQANELKKARKSLQKAARLLPQDVRPINELVFVALKSSKTGEARKLATKAIALNPNNSDAQYLLSEIEKLSGKYSAAIEAADKAIAITPNFSSAYLLKAEASIYNSMRDKFLPNSAEQKTCFTNAISILQTYPNISANTPETIRVRDMIEGYTAFADYYDQIENRKSTVTPSNENSVGNNPNEKRLEIQFKPRASYTEKARRNQVTGTTRILVLFSKNGTITAFPIKDLPDGLTEQATLAARQIKFLPMEKDGQPISVVKVIEYNFNLY